MDGNKLLQVITLLICLGLGYWIYKTNQEMHELLEENKIVWQKIDSLAGGVIAKPAPSRASSIFDDIISEAEKEYRKARKAESLQKITVSSSYRLEDRYVSYRVCTPEFIGSKEGTVILDITVSHLGDVSKARLNSGSTITDEEVIEACKKAALQTDFNYLPEAPDFQKGTITYTFTAK